MFLIYAMRKIYEKIRRSFGSAQLGQTSKTRQKWDSKSSWNWRIILVPETIRQIFESEAHAKTGNGSYESMPTFARKNSWNHFEGTYFWRVFCHLEPLCSANWTGLNMNASDFHVWRENSRQNEGRQSDVGLLWCNLFQFVAWNLKNRSTVSKVCFSSWWCKKRQKPPKSD